MDGTPQLGARQGRDAQGAPLALATPKPWQSVAGQLFRKLTTFPRVFCN